MSERPAIDPRYDPRFQRGYTGETPSKPADEPGSRAAWPTPKEVAGPAKVVVGPPRVVAPAVHGTEPARVAPPHPTTEGGVGEPIPRNPWALALLIVSAAMLASGLALSWHAAERDGMVWPDTTPILDIFMQQLLWVAPNILLTMGGFGVVVRVALAALWARDPR